MLTYSSIMISIPPCTKASKASKSFIKALSSQSKHSNLSQGLHLFMICLRTLSVCGNSTLWINGFTLSYPNVIDLFYWIFCLSFEVLSKQQILNNLLISSRTCFFCKIILITSFSKFSLLFASKIWLAIDSKKSLKCKISWHIELYMNSRCSIILIKSCFSVFFSTKILYFSENISPHRLAVSLIRPSRAIYMKSSYSALFLA